MAAWYQEHLICNKRGNKAGSPAGVSRPRGGQRSELALRWAFFRIFFLLCVKTSALCWCVCVSASQPLCCQQGGGGLHAEPAPLLTTPTESSPLCWRRWIPVRRQNAAPVLLSFRLPACPPPLPSSSSLCFFFFIVSPKPLYCQRCF